MSFALTEEMTQRVSDRWMDCNSLPESTLLRLALLRELLQKLHSEKSRCLAAGLKEDALSIKKFEAQVENLRESATLPYPIPEIFSPPQPIQRKKRILPEALFSSLEREKLLRYDRQWEATLAAEAATLSWRFWSLDSWVIISGLEEWERFLSQKLWPHGLVLFTESSEAGSPLQAEPSIWRGRWLVILHPKFKNPSELSLDFKYWQGFPKSAPNDPIWKRIYP